MSLNKYDVVNKACNAVVELGDVLAAYVILFLLSWYCQDSFMAVFLASYYEFLSGLLIVQL